MNAPTATADDHTRPLPDPDGPLYLAKLDLNPRSRLVSGEIRNAKSLIDRMMGMFPDAPRQPNGLWDRAGIGLLYRVDHGGESTAPAILLQAARQPDAALLPQDYGTLSVKPLHGMLAGLATGEQVSFRITVNPVTTPTGPGPKRRRVMGGEEADAWWREQARRAGLDLIAHRATQQPTLATGKMRVVLRRYDGHATVTDADALRTAIRNGIGAGKSYGAGLLTVA